jgi:transposase
VGVARKTVRAIARRYEEEGLEPALYEKPRPGKQRRLDAGQSLIAEEVAKVYPELVAYDGDGQPYSVR